MMSTKWAFSLTSLITILAFAFMVSPAAMAQTLSVEVKKQSPESPAYTLAADDTLVTTPAINIDLDVEFSHSAFATATTEFPSNTLATTAFDKDGNVVSAGVTVTDRAADDYSARSARKRQIRLALTPAAAGTGDDAKKGLITRIVVVIEGISTTDTSIPRVTQLDGDGNPTQVAPSFPRLAHEITINQPYTAPTGTDAGNRPQVVSIQRLRPGSQTVVAAFQEAKVTGAFDVRIVFTEEPHDFAKFAGKIKVTNGEKSNFTVGTPFPWFGGIDTSAGSPMARKPSAANQPYTVTPHPIEGEYMHNGMGVLAGVPPGVTTGDYASFVPLPSKNDTETTDDDMYYQCRVTITPHLRATLVRVSVDAFHDGGDHGSLAYNNYYQPIDVNLKPNGREELRLDVEIPQHDLDDGLKVVLPAGKIPYVDNTAGHYILTQWKWGSGIRYSAENADDPDGRLNGIENDRKTQTPAQMLYNVRQLRGPADTGLKYPNIMPNLERFLANSGTIHLVSYHKDSKPGDAYISEVMWGTDASLNAVQDSNWLEIRTAIGKEIAIGAGEWALWLYEAHETPATAYPAGTAYEGPIGQAGTIIDVIGTKDRTVNPDGLTWSIAGKGQSGRTNIDLARADRHVLAPTTPLISMYRVMVADTSTGAAAGAMKPGDGTMASSWKQTEAPSVNLQDGREHAYVATPGALPITTAEQVADAAKKIKDKETADAEKIRTTGTIPTAGHIYISEIMFAGGGVLPQWIEIANGSATEDINLSKWTLTVNNAAADADVDIGTAKFTIPDGTMINRTRQISSPSTILIVTEAGRNNIDAVSDQVIVLNAKGSTTEVDLINAGVTKRKYSLLSSEAFLITLAPPVPPKTKVAALAATATAAEKAAAKAADAKDAAMRKAATDMAGNLGADGTAAWALEMSEDGRSSIIRKHVNVSIGPSEPEDGMMMENWSLASKTHFADATHIRMKTYYGAANDVGTPGFRAGGALPVELSHFRPVRDKATGQVVITWSTQSELNNAGFFVKRSQQRNGEFKVINTTMVPGAGTTSEKQFYTYTDTTAQPNVVYYYQIEDVSLDGNRQTLTRGIRLKGHVGAAGKATTLWGELKTSHE